MHRSFKNITWQIKLHKEIDKRISMFRKPTVYNQEYHQADIESLRNIQEPISSFLDRCCLMNNISSITPFSKNPINIDNEPKWNKR